MRTCLMYHAACKVEFQPFKRSYSQLTFFNFLCLVHKNHIIRTCLMYHAACKVEFQPFTRSYSQLTFFNFLFKKKMNYRYGARLFAMIGARSSRCVVSFSLAASQSSRARSQQRKFANFQFPTQSPHPHPSPQHCRTASRRHRG